MTKYNQGMFKPKNPKKYAGDPKNIVYRSGWEFQFMMWLDSHPEVLSWASEELIVPYISPVDRRQHRYFPDFLFKTKDKTFMVEIKPLAQTQPPILKEGKMNKRWKKEKITFAINVAKWQAAKAWCKERGWEFRIITERDLNAYK